MLCYPGNKIVVQQRAIGFKLAIVAVAGIRFPGFIAAGQRLVQFVCCFRNNRFIGFGLHEKRRNGDACCFLEYSYLWFAHFYGGSEESSQRWEYIVGENSNKASTRC